MKPSIALRTTALLAVGLCAAPVLAADSPKLAARTTKSPKSLNFLETVPRSVFVVPTSHGEGRNPFFPRSARAQQQQQQVPRLVTKTPDASSLVLNGITGPPRRTAMINGYTFEQGEEAELKMSNGSKLLVRCEQIGDDFAVIIVGNTRKELRLRQSI